MCICLPQQTKESLLSVKWKRTFKPDFQVWDLIQLWLKSAAITKNYTLMSTIPMSHQILIQGEMLASLKSQKILPMAQSPSFTQRELENHLLFRWLQPLQRLINTKIILISFCQRTQRPRVKHIYANQHQKPSTLVCLSQAGMFPAPSASHRTPAFISACAPCV